MGSFKDFLRMLLHWWSSPATVTVVAPLVYDFLNVPYVQADDLDVPYVNYDSLDVAYVQADFLDVP